MIQRDPRFYVTGYCGKDPREAPFYLRSLYFDGPDGDLNAGLIEEFNSRVASSDKYAGSRLLPFEAQAREPRAPEKVIIINASFDNLPTSHETARIFREYLTERGYDAEVKVVDTLEDLTAECSEDPGNVLAISQCVDRDAYNVDVCRNLEKRGVVVVPGKVTAPGSIFSDKDSTYRLLSEDLKKWDKVARYAAVDVNGRSTSQVVDEVLRLVEELRGLTGKDVFFVKPNEGGGGLGGFRITRTKTGYVIPDLSKVSGDISDIHPTYIDLDTENRDKLAEAVWIYRLFRSDEKMAASYLRVNLPLQDDPGPLDQDVMKKYLEESAVKRSAMLEKMTLDPETAREKLISAIGAFETKFNRRYVPLVNEHLDFGLWGLRAHYRVSKRGPVLEGMYHRIFQLAFTEEGLGYLGSDNISNKQTGALEIPRLGPVNSVMLGAVGGKEALFETLEKGVDAVIALSALLPEDEARRVPVRAQLDLAAPARRIGEGNADTARGLCLASRWVDFVANAREWAEDSLSYYAWKRHVEKKYNRDATT